ncbi:hypothetical protein QBC38DRAFT_492219 [Podospora fimiseda]|uniref:Uncharacterized protein n=1 Tax=Podospora fimiseda TaxID=252190 RepID=A0AAN6YRZ2_9PEZI|nr:hypothetical protein QBC38DRAFT_492219 [Podospora fimiseda]
MSLRFTSNHNKKQSTIDLNPPKNMSRSETSSPDSVIEDITDTMNETTLTEETPDWTSKSYRATQIKLHGLSHIPTEPGLPNDFRQWRSRDKFVYTVLLTLVKDPQGLATAFGLQASAPVTSFDINNPHYQDFISDANYVNTTYKQLETAWHNADLREQVVDRWRWLNLEERWKVLIQCFPDIANKHRIDIYEAPELEENGRYRITTAPAAAYLTPQINLPDLVHADYMLLLMTERAKEEPRKFVHGDLERARIERLGKGVAFPYLYSGSINLEGSTADGDDYADIISGKTLEEFVDSDEVSGFALTINDGILAVKIQARILRGCLKYIELIRQLPPKQDKILNQTPHDDGFNLEIHSTLALHMQYRGKHQPISGIKYMAERMTYESRRRLWKLRNHPKSFQGWALEYYAHLPEHANDSTGKMHSDTQGNSTMMDMYDRAISALIADTYTRAIQWEILMEFLEEVEEHGYDKPRKWKKWTREQHEQFILSLLKLRKIIDLFMMRRTAGNILRTAAVHPEMSHFFVRASNTRTQISMKPNVVSETKDDVLYLFYLVSQAYNDSPDPRFKKGKTPLVPLDDVFVELNRQSDLKKIPQASKHLTTEIKEAGLLGLAMNYMRLTDPFGIVFSSLEGTDGAVLNLMPHIEQEMNDWMTNVLSLLNELDSVMRCVDTKSIYGLPRLAQDARVLEGAMKNGKEEEQIGALDGLWKKFDGHCEEKGSETLRTVLRRTWRKAREEASKDASKDAKGSSSSSSA